jgi:GMP synthase (glutamine-hydrolysing)
MIAVLDFGSQYTHLITRRIRELGVLAEIFDHTISADELKQKNVEGIVLSGGPNSVYEKDAPNVDQAIFSLGIPILGICYGLQLIAYINGGTVRLGKRRGYGEKVISIKERGKLFAGLDTDETVWFSHGDEATELPAGYKVLATTQDCPIAAYGHEKMDIYAIQFHPEVEHTRHGMRILENFLFSICNAEKNWKIKDVKEALIKELQNKIGEERVMIGVSGGVDSLVAAMLLHEAIGDNLYCVFIDTGLMRKDEGKQVQELFKSLQFHNFVTVEAEAEFLGGLKGVSEPEEKRKTFATVYFEIFSKQAARLRKDKHIEFLAQGTIYPDRIEAGKASKMAAVIKTHHNLYTPQKFGMEILEPLSEFYKDEVRVLGIELGLSNESVYRHPFPGPGLAIRILGEITPERITLLQDVDNIFIEELRKSGWYDKTWQAFAALLPVKSVGVMGDARTYQYMITLRAVTSKDAMTADWVRLPDRLLNKISKRITNEVHGINRVLYDITQKPPATIEYE